MSGVWGWLTSSANWQGDAGVPHRLIEHLQISAAAVLLAMAVALPVAIVLGHLGRAGFLAVNVGNVGRAIPTFGLLIIFASWSPIGVGNRAAILALALFAIPPLLTNTYIGMRGVDEDVKDAARGMGMTGGNSSVRKVEVPLAVPLIFAGHQDCCGPGRRHGHSRRSGRRRRAGALHRRRASRPRTMRSCTPESSSWCCCVLRSKACSR